MQRWIYCIALTAAAPLFAMELHVAPGGDDAGAGSAVAPYATLERARDAVRAAKTSGEMPADGVTVWVHGGDYFLDGSLLLGSEDSGEVGRSVRFAAPEGQMPRLIGGRRLPAESFVPLPETVRQRLEEGARAQVLSADLALLGITDLGVIPDQFTDAPVVPELYFNEKRMTLARWPNEGWAEIEKVVESGPAPWRKHESDQLGRFVYSGDRPARWISAPVVWLQGYWCFDWASEIIRAGKIDPELHEITLGYQHVYGIGSGNPAPRRFRAINLLEELDEPGEYFIDREAGQLYFWPPTSMTSARVVLSTLSTPLVQLQDASFITLQGLSFETCAGWAVEVKGGREIRVEDCTVRNTGQGGISVEGGERHTVSRCEIFDTGTDGIIMRGGDRKTLTPCGHEVIDNHLYRVSRRRPTHAYHIQIGGVGVRVAHNEIHDAPHQSILLAGNDHVLEYNEVYRICMDSDDCGAFYMGRNPSERGNVIRYNYWHDIGSSFAHGSCAVYFDDGAGGQRVYGNVFVRAAGGNFGAVFLHGGHDNWVENNLFIDCKRAVGHAPWQDGYWNEWMTGDLWKAKLLDEVDITKPPYTERYPDLANFMDTAPHKRVNHLNNNVVYQCADLMTGDWETAGNWVTTEDPGFVDAAAGNYALKPDAAVYREIPGFESIPFQKIGRLEENEETATAPK